MDLHDEGHTNDSCDRREIADEVKARVDLTQSELADGARLGLSTIVDFERSRRQISDDAIGAIRRALEKFGVDFIDENGGGAPSEAFWLTHALGGRSSCANAEVDLEKLGRRYGEGRARPT